MLVILFFSTIVSICMSRRIAIIGGGASGAFASHFIRKECTDVSEVVLFEKSPRMGGRIESIDISLPSENVTLTVELGASLGIMANRYFVKAAREANASFVMLKSEDKRVGILSKSKDGVFFAFKSEKGILGSIQSTLSFLWRYGFSMQRLGSKISDLVTKFQRIYSFQSQGIAFASPAELLRSLGLFDISQISLEKEMSTLSVQFRNEFLTGVTKTQYNQNTHINAFAGSIALAGIGSVSESFRISHGNDQMIQFLIENSDCRLKMGISVDAIVSEDGKVLLKSKGVELGVFDQVVLAVPFAESGISVEGVDGIVEYQDVFVTIVSGTMNPEYFGTTGQLPEIILTDSHDFSFSSIGTLFQSNSGLRVVKFFSTVQIHPNVLSRIFHNEFIVHKVKHWKAYPRFPSQAKFLPFEIAPGLFYPNAMESAASAIEVMAVSARNTALLLCPRQQKDEL